MRRRPPPLVLVVYVIVGVAVAASHHYLTELHTLRQIASGLLAVGLWPLILLGINLHIHK